MFLQKKISKRCHSFIFYKNRHQSALSMAEVRRGQILFSFYLFSGSRKDLYINIEKLQNFAPSPGP
jgi:hypothetical protein